MTKLLPELTFSFSRSGGKGGQHVNKVSTKVLLRFNLLATELLSEAQKTIIQEKLRNYINQDGELLLTCDETRSQLKNKEIVIKRFTQLIETALKPVKKRRKTQVPRSVKEKRLKDKMMNSQKKQNRRKDVWN